MPSYPYSDHPIITNFPIYVFQTLLRTLATKKRACLHLKQLSSSEVITGFRTINFIALTNLSENLTYVPVSNQNNGLYPTKTLSTILFVWLVGLCVCVCVCVCACALALS
jgi:hypothetical protein